MLVRSNDTRSPLITPCAVGRIVSEIPSRMLSVANVAISDGILSPRIRHGVDQPEAEAAGEDRPRPRSGSGSTDASAPIRNEPTTTPKLIIAPTDRSRYPTRSACVWAIAASASGMRQQQDRRDVGLVDEAREPELGVQEQRHDQQHLQHHRHPQPELDDLAPLVLVAGVAERPCGRPVAPRRPGVSLTSRSWTSDGRLPWHRHAERRSRRPRHPGAAHDRLDDAQSRPARRRGSPRRSCPATSRAPGRTDPESSMGSLDLTSIAAPAAARHAGRRRCRTGSRRRRPGWARRPGSPTAP